MMKSIFVLFAIFAVATALAVPKRIQKPDGPECGAKNVGRDLLLGHIETSFTCEICLDLVLIAEMYAECDEDYGRQQMDSWCRKKAGDGSLLDKLCEDLVNDVMYELEKDTDADASTVCTKVLKKKCSYGSKKQN